MTHDPDVEWEAPIFKARWTTDHVTNRGPRENLKNLYFHYHQSYGQ